MPPTIERPTAANVVAHATEYPRDRDRREQGDRSSEDNASDTERQDQFEFETAETSGAPDSPDVLVDHVVEDHRLDGVAAYTHLGEQARLHLKEPSSASTIVKSSESHAPSEVRQAYEGHTEEPEDHQINLAT